MKRTIQFTYIFIDILCSKNLLIGLRRAKFENKDILGLSEAYKEIFATKNINENISKLNGSFQENPLVKEVIEFITKDKKRSICTPFS